MKAHEIILQERRLTASEYDELLADDSVKIGFECETMISAEREGDTVEADAQPWDELEQYLDISRSIRFRTKEAFDRFVDRKTVEGDDTKYTMDDFIRLNYGTNTIFMHRFGIEPLYGWNEGGGGDRLLTGNSPDHGSIRQQAAENIGDSLEVEINVFSEYHKEEKNQSEWYIEPDGSLTDTDAEIGAEIVSSVYALNGGLSKLEKLFGWIGRNARTTEDTGLHINLSIAGKPADEYDFLKMMIFYDENYVADMFGRLGNDYCLEMRSRIMDFVKKDVKPAPTQHLDVFDVMTSRNMATTLKLLHGLGTKLAKRFDKYVSMQSRDNGVFEFRGMGGAGYEMEFEKIRKQVIRMAGVLKLGSSRTMLAKEYVTKVVNLLASGKYGDASLQRTSYDPVPYSLVSFEGIFRKFPNFRGQPPASMILNVAIRVMNHAIAPLSPLQRRQLRLFGLKHKFTPAAFWRCYNDNKTSYSTWTVYNVVADIMGWPAGVRYDDPAQRTLPFAVSSTPAVGSTQNQPDNDFDFNLRQEEIPNILRHGWTNASAHDPAEAYQRWRDGRRT